VFEMSYKALQVRFRRRTLQEKVQVIWQKAVSAKVKGMLARLVAEGAKQPSGERVITKIGSAPESTQGEKIPANADVVSRVKADAFVTH